MRFTRSKAVQLLNIGPKTKKEKLAAGVREPQRACGKKGCYESWKSHLTTKGQPNKRLLAQGHFPAGAKPEGAKVVVTYVTHTPRVHQGRSLKRQNHWLKTLKRQQELGIDTSRTGVNSPPPFHRRRTVTGRSPR